MARCGDDIEPGLKSKNWRRVESCLHEVSTRRLQEKHQAQLLVLSSEHWSGWIRETARVLADGQLLESGSKANKRPGLLGAKHGIGQCSEDGKNPSFHRSGFVREHGP